MKRTRYFLFYSSEDGKIKTQVSLDTKKETVWTTQKGMSEIFNVDRTNITKHLTNIFQEGELEEVSVCEKISHTASDGKKYDTMFYNLDAIIAVGYRVNSYQATQFRIWATKILKEYLIKGFALDDERLKQGKTLLNKDYWNELIERIREIRASERRFYQKITDLYAQASIDYDKNSPITQQFFAKVQNKLHFAITHHTASEIIALRADSKKPQMGLTSWKAEPIGGKILRSDVSIAKNYLDEKEIKELNRIVNMYLDYAENQAERQKPMTMSDWVKRLDAFLRFNEYDICIDAGKISRKIALRKADKEYDKFRIIQDNEYESDFDKVVKQIQVTGELPKESPEEDLSDFDKGLKGLLSVPPEKK